MEIVLILVIALVVAYIYTPFGDLIRGNSAAEASFYSSSDNQYYAKATVSIPEDSMLKRHFLANLQAEVESDLAPRPTCSMLKRHHDTLVSEEMKSRMCAA